MPEDQTTTTVIPDDEVAATGQPSDSNPNESVKTVSIFERINRLPEVIRLYIYSDEFQATNGEIYREHKLTQDERDTVLFTELHVFLGDLALDDFPDKLWARLPWEDSQENRASLLVTDILGKIFLPAQAFVGDVMALIYELGGDPNKYHGKQLQVRIEQYDKGVTGIIEALGLDKAEESADLRRLRHIIESRLRNVRDDMDTQRILVKSKKVGGLEMSEEDAKRVIDVIASEMRMTKFVDVLPDQESKQDEQNKYGPEEIRARLAGPVEEQKRVAENVQLVIREAGNHPETTREALYDLMLGIVPEADDSLRVAATLLVLARQQGLVDSLEKDERFQEAIETFVDEMGDEKLLKTVKDNPAGRDAMNIFLQLVLRDVAQLEEEDSARYGFRVTNALKKTGHAEYVDLVAFDLDEGKFVWSEPVQA